MVYGYKTNRIINISILSCQSIYILRKELKQIVIMVITNKQGEEIPVHILIEDATRIWNKNTHSRFYRSQSITPLIEWIVAFSKNSEGCSSWDEIRLQLFEQYSKYIVQDSDHIEILHRFDDVLKIVVPFYNVIEYWRSTYLLKIQSHILTI